MTACASRCVRGQAKERALLQVGNKVPIYATSLFGVALLKARIDQIKSGGTMSTKVLLRDF